MIKIRLQDEEYSKVIELEIGDDMYATVICNLDTCSSAPDRFIIVKELSKFDESLTDKVLDYCKNIAISKSWYY